METDLTAPIFTDDEAARLHFEALRWDGGVPVCFHCGVVGDAILVARDAEHAAKQKKAGKKAQRPGLYYCRACGGQFTATMGTVYEDSHIPMRKWLLATHLMNASKKGVSALQLQRMLGLGSYRSAWFMAHRIREGMSGSAGDGPLGGEGQVVEADETYFHNVENPATVKADGTPFYADRPRDPRLPRANYGTANKRSVVVLVERGGKAKAFHVGNANRDTVEKLLNEHASKASRLHTDESPIYKRFGSRFAAHETVNHTRKEYVRGDVHNNSAEGFFNVFKRGMTGTYQHCGEAYLQRYVTEFEFRHNNRVKLGVNDKERAARAVKGTVGKRLTLRPSKSKRAPA
jgi:hypothetical protein